MRRVSAAARPQRVVRALKPAPTRIKNPCPLSRVVPPWLLKEPIPGPTRSLAFFAGAGYSALPVAGRQNGVQPERIALDLACSDRSAGIRTSSDLGR